jgi:hypothetical protein
MYTSKLSLIIEKQKERGPTMNALLPGQAGKQGRPIYSSRWKLQRTFCTAWPVMSMSCIADVFKPLKLQGHPSTMRKNKSARRGVIQFSQPRVQDAVHLRVHRLWSAYRYLLLTKERKQFVLNCVSWSRSTTKIICSWGMPGGVLVHVSCLLGDFFSIFSKALELAMLYVPVRPMFFFTIFGEIGHRNWRQFQFFL